MQQNDIKEPVLINGKRCDYSSELDDNLREKLFDVRVRKWIKHCAKRVKRFIAPYKHYHFSASAVIAVGSSKEHTTHEFGYTQPIEGNAVKDKHLYVFGGKYTIYRAIGIILYARSNLTHLPFLHLTLTFEIKPRN